MVLEMLDRIQKITDWGVRQILNAGQIIDAGLIWSAGKVVSAS